MVSCVGNAPTPVRSDIRFTGGPRSLRDYQPWIWNSWWTATALHRALPLAIRRASLRSACSWPSASVRKGNVARPAGASNGPEPVEGHRSRPHSATAIRSLIHRVFRRPDRPNASARRGKGGADDRSGCAARTGFIEIHATLNAARKREAGIKKWSRAKKEALIAGQFARLKRLSGRRD